MDKIINGVDVSECDNLAILQDRMTDEEFTFCNAYQEDCSERENCHYKQLKRLQAENERLKDFLNHSFCDCEINEKYRKALQEIRKIIDFRFKTSYMTLGFKEYDELIEDIDKIVNEVIGAE